jgi:Flp pilus assembly pilin Flp
MFRSLFRNKKGQNTAEYALLIALVIAGIVAMQQYAQRALQARVRDASTFMATNSVGDSGMGSSKQYEPYYSNSSYTVNKDTSESQEQGAGLVRSSEVTDRARSGSQSTTYGAGATVGNGDMPQGL